MIFENIEAVFRVVAPATYWIIAALWAAIFILLIKRASIFRGGDDALKVLLIVLAIDACRTFVESVYFGTLFNAHFGFFPESLQGLLQSPVLLALPKFVNIAAGALVLVLIVRRWIPTMDRERERAAGSAEDERRILELEKDRLVRAQAVAKVGSWEADLATMNATWSAETFRIFDVDPKAFIPTHANFLSVVHPDDRDLVDKAFRQSFYTREICEIEHRLLRNGQVKVVSERWQTFSDGNGTPTVAVGTCRDITDIRAFEEKAKEAAYQLRIASDVALLGAWSYNLGSPYVVWSEQTAQLHDMPSHFHPTVAEAIEFYVPEDRGKIQKAFEACLEHGMPFSETLEIITAHGRRLCVKAIGEAVRDPSGKIVRVHGAFQDISALAESQKSLKLLEAAVSRLNDIVIITEAEPIETPGPSIVFVNKAFEQHTEYTELEVLGRSPRFLQGQKTQRHELNRIRSAISRHESIRSEIINYTKSGKEFWLEVDLAPILNAAGKCTHFVAVERDITERKARDARLSEMSSRLVTLIDNAPIGVLVHQDFKPVIANKELARIFGYDGENEIVDMESCRELFAEDERERIAAYNRSRLSGGQTPGFYLVKGKRKDGSVIELENRAFAIQWGDKLSVCAMLTDVTSQRQVEAQLRQAQRLEAVGQMTGGIAHDFNNLLTVILGNAEFLEDGLSYDPDLQSMATLTKKAAERGADLTARLLAFSRQQPLDPKITDINDLVEKVEPLLGRALGGHSEIKEIQHPNLWRVLVDGPQFENALLNLAVNARDAMTNGGCLTIETSNIVIDPASAVDQSEIPVGEYVCIAVSDNGDGMDEQTRLRVFEPFFTTKDVGKGSGLGLSMVYGLVKQSRGYIKIYSELGHGTTVKIYLPRVEADAGIGQSQTETFPLTGGNEKILVVEDDELVRGQVTSQLKTLGYEIVSARNGAEALAILANHADFDLLFTDVVMPEGINGPRLAEEALKLYPSLSVLFTSGYTENAVVHHGQLDSGVNLLNKPYRRQELASRVRTALVKSNKPRSDKN